MLKFARFFVKALLSIIAILILAIVVSGIYVSINQKELSQKFLSAIDDEINLNLSYSDLNLSLVSNFPFAAFKFDNLEIKLQNASKPITLLKAQKVNLTINTIHLIQGKFNIRNCILNDGYLNYYPKPIDSLINEFSRPNHEEKNSNSFNLNKFSIKNYIINVYDYKNKLLVNLNIDNALVDFNLNDEKLNASIKTKVSRIKSKEFLLHKMPISIDLILEGSNGVYVIPQFNLNLDKTEIEGSGSYNHLNGNAQFNYTTNNFETRRLTDMLEINPKNIEFIGKSKLSGSIDHNFKSNKLKKLSINHKSKGTLKFEDKFLKINEIIAKTTITDDFNTHITNVQKVDMEYENIKALMSARIKGIKEPIILTEGDVAIKSHKIAFYDKSLTIDANGKVKALISTDSLYKNKLKFHSIKGSLNYNVIDIAGINRVNGLSGTIAIDKNLVINSTGKFDEKPFSLTIDQKNILSIINNNSIVNPIINIKAESIDIDYIASIIDEMPEDKNSESNNNQYIISVVSDNLRYMNYDFLNVQSSMLLTNNLFEIRSFSGNGFDGKIKGSLKNIDNLYYIDTDFENLNISKLFKHYNDFDQAVVSHTNINGNLSGNAFLKFSTTEKGDIFYPSLKLESDITISDGKLIGMNKIDKLSKWLKLDQVKSIDFKTLHNRIEISDQCVRIPKMDINSNVINMQLSGEHLFSGNFTYLMKINFSQVLSRRFLNSSISNEDDYTSNGSINLYLKLFGDKNNYDIKLDKKSSFENIRGSVQSEGKTLKEIFKEEFKQITKKDTATNTSKDSILRNNTKFNIEWDEYDTLNVDNN